MINIVIAEDHAGLRTALRMVLELEADFRIVGETTDGETVLKLASDTVPNILVADLDMPGPNSIKLAVNLRNLVPHTNLVIIGHDADPNLIAGTLRAGAKAYVNKEWINEGLALVIRDVTGCEKPIQADGLFDQSSRLPRPAASYIEA